MTCVLFVYLLRDHVVDVDAVRVSRVGGVVSWIRECRYGEYSF